MTEEATTAASRIFIKIIFQDLTDEMGLDKLQRRLQEPGLQPFLGGLLPQRPPEHVRFSVNFFTAIGLGVLAEHLREYLVVKEQPPR